MFAIGNDRFDMRTLMRLSSWGAGAALALALAVTSGMSATGSRRASVAYAAWTGSDEPQRQVTAAQLIPRSSDVEGETRRLNEAIRLLAADRDRLATRVGSLERNVDDMTGSIRQSASRSSGNAASSPLPQISSLQSPSGGLAPDAATPATVPMPAPHTPHPTTGTWPSNSGPAPWPSPSSAMPIAPAPASRMATAPTTGDTVRNPAASKTEFGVDIGSGEDIESLRAIWNSTKARHGNLIGALRPVYSIIDNRSGEPEMRLIIGPLANAAAAAKLCATLGAADVLCSTRQFTGQKLP
jgi:hypothetical protein